MAFRRIPSRLLSTALLWHKAVGVVMSKLEGLDPSVSGRYELWCDQQPMLHPSAALIYPQRLGYSYYAHSEWISGLVGMADIQSVDRAERTQPTLGVIYGSSGVTPATTSVRWQAEQELVNYWLDAEPTGFSQYIDFLASLVQAAPREVVLSPHPWMLVNEAGELQIFELDRSSYKKQLALLKTIGQKSRLKKHDLDQARLCFPKGSVLGWFDFKPLREVSFQHHSATQQDKSGSLVASAGAGPPMWLALEQWLDDLETRINAAVPGAVHEIWLDFEYAPLEYFLFKKLSDRLAAGQLSYASFKDHHLNKWLYGYHALGYWFEFLDQAQELTAWSWDQPPQYKHFVRRQVEADGRGWGLAVVTMGPSALLDQVAQGDQGS